MNRIRKIFVGILLFFCGVSLVWADDKNLNFNYVNGFNYTVINEMDLLLNKTLYYDNKFISWRINEMDGNDILSTLTIYDASGKKLKTKKIDDTVFLQFEVHDDYLYVFGVSYFDNFWHLTIKKYDLNLKLIDEYFSYDEEASGEIQKKFLNSLIQYRYSDYDLFAFDDDGNGYFLFGNLSFGPDYDDIFIPSSYDIDDLLEKWPWISDFLELYSAGYNVVAYDSKGSFSVYLLENNDVYTVSLFQNDREVWVEDADNVIDVQIVGEYILVSTRDSILVVNLNGEVYQTISIDDIQTNTDYDFDKYYIYNIEGDSNKFIFTVLGLDNNTNNTVISEQIWSKRISIKTSIKGKGTVDVDDLYEYGDGVEFTVTPEEGYRVKSISVVDLNGNEIEHENGVIKNLKTDVLIKVRFVKEDGFDLYWSHDPQLSCGRPYYFEISDGFVLFDYYGSAFKYSFEDGFVSSLNLSDSWEALFAYKLNDIFVVAYLDRDKKTYLVSIDENLNVLNKVSIDENYSGDYFIYDQSSEVEVKNNKLVFTSDNYLSSFTIDKNLNVVQNDLNKNGEYFLYSGYQVTKYDRNHKPIKSINLDYTIHNFIKYDDKFIAISYNSYNLIFYVFDEEINLLNQKKFNDINFNYYIVNSKFYVEFGVDWFVLNNKNEFSPLDKAPVLEDNEANEENKIAVELMKKYSNYYVDYIELDKSGYIVRFYDENDNYRYGYFDKNLNLVFSSSYSFYVTDYYFLSFDDDNGLVKLYDRSGKYSGDIILPDGAYINFIFYSDKNNFVFIGNLFSNSESSRMCQAYNYIMYYYKDNNIITKNDGNGDVVSNKDKAAVGEEVYITIHPNEGYYLKSLTVIDEDGNEIEVVDNKFIMPNSDVTIEVTFEKIEENPDTADIIFISIVALVACGVVYFVNRKKIKFIK